MVAVPSGLKTAPAGAFEKELTKLCLLSVASLMLMSCFQNSISYDWIQSGCISRASCEGRRVSELLRKILRNIATMLAILLSGMRCVAVTLSISKDAQQQKHHGRCWIVDVKEAKE